MQPRGQMAMWILTKFALLFFITALFAIIFVFEEREKERVCKSQTEKVAQAIAGRLMQVVDSPVEDEQRAYSFTQALQLGKSEERYRVNITYFHAKPANGQWQKISITAYPVTTRGCEASASVDFSAVEEVNLISPRPFYEFDFGTFTSRQIVLAPSDPDPSGTKKSYHMMIIKCSSKSLPLKKYLFLEDCNKLDPNQCIGFDSDTINAACGFPV